MLPRLTLIDDAIYTFNADGMAADFCFFDIQHSLIISLHIFDSDYMKIRCEHRIVGKLVGASVKWPRNINLAGLPAIYSPYQVQLLLDNGLVCLSKRKLDDAPDDDAVATYANVQATNQREFTENYVEKKLAEAMKIVDKVVGGKRRKIERTGGNPEEVSSETVLNELRQKWNVDAGNILVQVPTQESFADG